MKIKDRVKLLRRDNEILASKISELEDALIDIQDNIHERFNTVHWASSRDVFNLRKEVEEKLENCKDAINNQHKTLKEEKAELETRYTKAIYALRLIVSMNPNKFRGTEVHHILNELGVIPR